ncbi:MAG: hypothetical protein PHY28_08420 [Dehalococcoidales bacterium]|nr:hypothetical protein [Dehalococcoidales bacterium]
MTTKAKMQTKADLIQIIIKNTRRIPARFQPAVKRDFLVGLKYKNKGQLKRIASKMIVEVDKSGWGIKFR